MYVDCEIIEGSHKLDPYGCPLATVEILNRPITIAGLLYLKDWEEREGSSFPEPIIEHALGGVFHKCKEVCCVNVDHYFMIRVCPVRKEPYHILSPEFWQIYTAEFHQFKVQRGEYMSDLSTLRKSINELGDDERRELIRNTRTSRRIGPAKRQAQTDGRRSKKKTKEANINVKRKTVDMSDDAKKRLIEKMKMELGL